MKEKHTYGPNDASGVVWAFFVFEGLRWPSLAVVGCRGLLWACVGLRWLLWAFVGLRWPSVAVVGCYGNLLSIKWKKKTKKNIPRAEMTRLASFGPFFSLAAHPNPHR